MRHIGEIPGQSPKGLQGIATFGLKTSKGDTLPEIDMGWTGGSEDVIGPDAGSGRLDNLISRLPRFPKRTRLATGATVGLAATAIGVLLYAGMRPHSVASNEAAKSNPGITQVEVKPSPPIDREVTGTDGEKIITEAANVITKLNERFLSQPVIFDPLHDRASASQLIVSPQQTQVDMIASLRGHPEDISVVSFPGGPNSTDVLVTFHTGSQLTSQALKALLSKELASSMPRGQLTTTDNGDGKTNATVYQWEGKDAGVLVTVADNSFVFSYSMQNNA